MAQLEFGSPIIFYPIIPSLVGRKGKDREA